MPPEHEIIFSMMASIMYACRKHSKIDMKVVRLKLVRAKRAAGLRGRYNWSNGMRHGVDRVCDVLRQRVYEGPGSGTLWWRPYSKASKYQVVPTTPAEMLRRVIEACEVALKKPRLLPHERTWQEQIVGRATSASKTYFPDLTNG